MATITGATTTSTLATLIPTERLNALVMDPHAAPSPINELLWIEEGTGASTYIFNRLDEPNFTFTEASGKTEFDSSGLGTPDAINSTGATVTPVVVGLPRALSYEGASDAQALFSVEDAISNTLIGMRKRIFIDAALNVVGHSKQADYSGLALNIQRLGEAQATFGAQNPIPGSNGLALLLHDDQYKDLAADLRLTHASLESTGRNVQLLSTLPGFKGFYEDLAVFVTGNVQQADASNWSGAIMSIGVGGAIGMAWWQHIPRTPNTPFEFVGGYLIQMENAASGQGDYIYVSSRYGTVVTDPANLTELITKKAA
jgi:hypothetical protein